jgi:hypothetical protein
MQEQRYIGVDYHRRFSYMTVIDEKAKIVREGTVNNDREVVVNFLMQAQCDGDCREGEAAENAHLPVAKGVRQFLQDRPELRRGSGCRRSSGEPPLRWQTLSGGLSL